MKRIQHTARSREKLLHIETEGCIVNIRVGLSDSEGRAVTSVEIVPDKADRGGDGEGRVWTLDGTLNNRVIRQPEDEGILSEREARKARGQEGWEG